MTSLATNLCVLFTIGTFLFCFFFFDTTEAKKIHTHKFRFIYKFYLNFLSLVSKYLILFYFVEIFLSTFTKLMFFTIVTSRSSSNANKKYQFFLFTLLFFSLTLVFFVKKFLFGFLYFLLLVTKVLQILNKLSLIAFVARVANANNVAKNR